MNKVYIGIATTSLIGLCGIIGTTVSEWVHERNADHEILKQLWWKDYYLNGPVPAAPVNPPKK